MKPAVVHGIFLTISGLLFMAVSLFYVNVFDYAAPIPYKDWTRITLEDFRGLKRPFERHRGTDRFAFIATEIRVERNQPEKWQVTTFFHPSRSYVFNPRIWYKGLLRHEIYHLHVTELASRQLRQAISELDKPSESDVKKLQKRAYDFEHQMQVAYDTESDHSIKLREQKSWEAKIDSLLAATSHSQAN